MADFVIAQLARAPAPGEVKTRMLSALSPERAANLHAAMVLYICNRLLRVAPLQLWVTGDVGAPVFKQCILAGAQGPYPQEGTDLGERMQHIAGSALQDNRKLIMVGSDAPALDEDYLRRAGAVLDTADVVIGPAQDGGYVLLGLSRSVPVLFEDIPWGTERVLEFSLEALEAEAVKYSLLEPLPDIDRPEDLRHLPDDLDW